MRFASVLTALGSSAAMAVTLSLTSGHGPHPAVEVITDDPVAREMVTAQAIGDEENDVVRGLRRSVSDEPCRNERQYGGERATVVHGCLEPVQSVHRAGT